jgi:hypothetical protein
MMINPQYPTLGAIYIFPKQLKHHQVNYGRPKAEKKYTLL